MTTNRKFELIDKCIEETTTGHPGLKTPLLKNITQGIEYRYLDCPCGRRQFYEYRREFFSELDRKRN